MLSFIIFSSTVSQRPASPAPVKENEIPGEYHAKQQKEASILLPTSASWKPELEMIKINNACHTNFFSENISKNAENVIEKEKINGRKEQKRVFLSFFCFTTAEEKQQK